MIKLYQLKVKKRIVIQNLDKIWPIRHHGKNEKEHDTIRKRASDFDNLQLLIQLIGQQ